MGLTLDKTLGSLAYSKQSQELIATVSTGFIDEAGEVLSFCQELAHVRGECSKDQIEEVPQPAVQASAAINYIV
jgi:hypothetical protein